MSSQTVSKNVLLIFKKEVMYNPVISRTIKRYDILFNILEAKILPKQEGRLILQLEGELDLLDQAVAYMESEGVKVEVLSERVRRDEDRCVHCGACTAVCKTGALYMDRSTMQVLFDPELCVVCGQCQLACPVKAVQVAGIDIDVPAA
ncbi:NIL domain-containing protein [Desulfovermiculus halophilus]|uniref:NIL domain-containing protein n=1 Tax=Desulfovermiculus halophilus TaxID=339722 RepID=UPI000486899D|nr:NIL domain-containing protein [Desulfovermiculus halophilus]